MEIRCSNIKITSCYLVGRFVCTLNDRNELLGTVLLPVR